MPASQMQFDKSGRVLIVDARGLCATRHALFLARCLAGEDGL
jgi:hypothetical protein